MVEAVGVEAQVSAPPEVELDVLKQKEIDVLAPFAVTEPFKVALVEPTDEAADVVAVGTKATNVYEPLKVAVPPGAVSTTSTAPIALAGVVTVTVVELTTVTDVPLVPPKVTPVVPVKFVPVIVIDVPPKYEPDVGDIELVVGGAADVVNVRTEP